MSGAADWAASLPSHFNGFPVQRPVKADVAMPEGYTRATALVDPFEAFCFASFSRDEPDGRTRYAMPIDARHVNQRGVAHGGLLMTFADSVLGLCAWTACPPATWCVTVAQQSNFLRAVHTGDLVEVTPQVLRAARSMIFVRGDFFVKDEIVFTAQSAWKVSSR